MTMQLSGDEWHELGVALNEATLRDLDVDSVGRRAVATFEVLTFPENGAPTNAVVRFVFESVGRVAAWLRLGAWNDPTAPIEEFELEKLSSIVRSFKGQPIYGWEFFDIAERGLSSLRSPLSLDVSFDAGGRGHSISLFQEDDRHLDLWLWFDTFTITDASNRPMSIDEFTKGGQRWWEAFYNHDLRTQGGGMMPLADGRHLED